MNELTVLRIVLQTPLLVKFYRPPSIMNLYLLLHTVTATGNFIAIVLKPVVGLYQVTVVTLLPGKVRAIGLEL